MKSKVYVDEDGNPCDADGRPIKHQSQGHHGLMVRPKKAANANTIHNQSEGGDSFFHNQSAADSQQVFKDINQEDDHDDEDQDLGDENQPDDAGKQTLKKRESKHHDKIKGQIKPPSKSKKKENLNDIFPNDNYYESDLLKIKGERVEGKDGKVRVRLTEEQVRYFLKPFVTLIQRFTQAPMSSSKWTSNLYEIFYGKAVIVDAFEELKDIWWYTNEEPQKHAHKFDFQFVGYAKTIIEKIEDLEEQLVLHADYIIRNHKKMIYDPVVRDELRYFDHETHIYWSPTLRSEMDREKNVT